MSDPMKTTGSGISDLPSSAGPLHAYLAGYGRDNRGRSAHEILSYSNKQLEEIHDYIQWLFPLPTRSAAQPDAPILTASETKAISSDHRTLATLHQATIRMERFYRETEDWLTGYDHNHLRITRIIQSLRHLASPEAAAEFHSIILELHAAAGAPINQRSLQYWKQASEA